jgi:hypothetical protein
VPDGLGRTRFAVCLAVLSISASRASRTLWKDIAQRVDPSKQLVGWYAWVGEGLRVQAGEEQRTTEPASTLQASFEEPDLSERAWQLQERSVWQAGERNGMVGGGRSAVIIAAVDGVTTHHQGLSRPTMTKQRKGVGLSAACFLTVRRRHTRGSSTVPPLESALLAAGSPEAPIAERYTRCRVWGRPGERPQQDLVPTALAATWA